jgi:hypothetical protein
VAVRLLQRLRGRQRGRGPTVGGAADDAASRTRWPRSVRDAKATWTPRGYILNGVGAAVTDSFYLGRAAYGGTDTSPPGSGYGLGSQVN